MILKALLEDKCIKLSYFWLSVILWYYDMMLYAMIGPRRKGFQDRWKDGLGFLLLLVVSPGQAHRSFHLYSMEEMMMMVIVRPGLIILFYQPSVISLIIFSLSRLFLPHYIFGCSSLDPLPSHCDCYDANATPLHKSSSSSPSSSKILILISVVKNNQQTVNI